VLIPVIANGFLVITVVVSLPFPTVFSEKPFLIQVLPTVFSEKPFLLPSFANGFLDKTVIDYLIFANGYLTNRYKNQ